MKIPDYWNDILKTISGYDDLDEKLKEWVFIFVYLDVGIKFAQKIMEAYKTKALK